MKKIRHDKIQNMSAIIASLDRLIITLELNMQNYKKLIDRKQHNLVKLEKENTINKAKSVVLDAEQAVEIIENDEKASQIETRIEIIKSQIVRLESL
jgi:hypothetical protein